MSFEKGAVSLNTPKARDRNYWFWQRYLQF